MKTLSIEVSQQLRSQAVRICLLAEITLPSAAVRRMWSGIGTLSYGGNDYVGVGKLGRIVGAGETAEIRTTETSYQLSGLVDSTDISDFISHPIRNGTAKAWIAFLDANEQVIGVILIDQTILDAASISHAASGEATLTLRGTSAIFDFRKPRARFVTNEQLQADYPGDTGFDRIAGLADKEISWTLS